MMRTMYCLNLLYQIKLLHLCCIKVIRHPLRSRISYCRFSCAIQKESVGSSWKNIASRSITSTVPEIDAWSRTNFVLVLFRLVTKSPTTSRYWDFVQPIKLFNFIFDIYLTINIGDVT